MIVTTNISGKLYKLNTDKPSRLPISELIEISDKELAKYIQGATGFVQHNNKGRLQVTYWIKEK